MVGIMKWFNRILDTVNQFFFMIAAFMVVFIIVSITMEVCSRIAFNLPIRYIIELNQVSLLYLTFLSGAILLRKEKHVSIDIITNMLGVKYRALMNAITSVIGVGCCLIVTWYGFSLCYLHIIRDFTITGTTFPRYIQTVVIPIGFLFLTIEFIKRTHKYFTIYKDAGKNETDTESGIEGGFN